MVLVPAINLYDNIRRKYNNDGIDRLSHVYSSSALILFALIFLFETIVDKPVVCLGNAYENDMWFRYINSYCYVENKYFITLNQTGFPVDQDTRKAVSVDYYPWILVVFIIQAIFFVLPHWAWEALNPKTGIPLRSLAIGLTVNEPKAKKVYGKRTNGLDLSSPVTLPVLVKALKFNLKRTDKVFCIFSPRAYLSSIYVMYKLANLVNAVFQLFFLNNVLIARYAYGGIDILWDVVVKEIDWSISGHFPRIAFCDFNRRDDPTGSSFEGTAQCLLPFNLLYECMFVAIWFWLAALLLINFCSVIETISFVQSDSRRIKFVEDLLYPHNTDKHPDEYEKDQENLQYFVQKVLGEDGVVTLRLLHANLTHHKISNFTKALFKECSDLLPNAIKKDGAKKVAKV